MNQIVSDSVVVCPYCGYEYQPEPCDYHDDMQDEECQECSKTFVSYDDAKVYHYTLKKDGE